MNKFFALVLVMLLIYTNAFALGGTSNSQGTSSIPSAGGSGSGTVTNIATGNGLTGGPITNTGTINLSTPDVTKIANYPLAAGDMAGQVNFNASSLTVTIPAISGTVFANGMTSLVTNYNSSALTISSTPTINGYSGTSIGQYGWVNFTSNGTSLDAFGFPGFGTITSNALSKFSGTGGIQTASSITDDGTTISLGAGGATVTESSGNANFGAITVSSCTGCGASGGTVTLGTSAAATNPQRTGEATTGLYSLTSGEVDIGGTKFNFVGGPIQLGGVTGISFPTTDSGTNHSIAIGSGSLATQAGSQAYDNTAVGFNALNKINGATGTQSTAVGSQALAAQTLGTVAAENVGIGYDAGLALTTGYQNVFIGAEAWKTGNPNTDVAIGYNSGGGAGTGDVAIGRSAGNSGMGNNNVVIGSGAGLNLQGASSVMIGQGAGPFNVSSTNCTAVGFTALCGTGDTAVGYQALKATASNSNNNTGIGFNALAANTTGTSNTALGANALLLVTTGTTNTAVGAGVGSTILTTGTGNILVGTSNGTTVPASGTANFLNIGNLLQGDVSKGIFQVKGSNPALTSCGTSPAVGTGANNTAGTITEGSIATGCTITFANPFANVPGCVVTSQSGLVFSYTVSASAIVVTNIGALSSTILNYMCVEPTVTNNAAP